MFLYNFLIWLITILILPFWIINQKIKDKPVLPYFLGFSKRELALISGKKVLWIQAASVGETMVAARILQELKKAVPDFAIVFTGITKTGHATAEKVLNGLADLIGYFPFDHPWVARRFLNRLNPNLLILVETEIWPNVLTYAKKRDVKIAILNGRLDKSYNRLKNFNFYKPVLRLIDFFAVQTEEDYQRFIALGALPDKVAVMGNVKFDFEYPVITQEQKDGFLSQLDLTINTPIFTAASTHHGEEEIVLKAFQSIKQKLPSAFLILAPRYPEETVAIEKLLTELNLTWMRRTEMLQNKTCSGPLDLLLIDTFGELGLIYSVSTVVFVGGSMVPVGGHNILEASAQAKIVLYGPYMDNVREISRQLEEAGVSFTVSNERELAERFIHYATEEDLRVELGEKAKQIILDNQGATQKMVNRLQTILKELPK